MIEIKDKIYNNILLDRDGVINVERKNDYAKSISEFIFENKALEAIAILSQNVDNVFIITNQRGVGRGLMTLDDLENIHSYMTTKIVEYGGKVTNIYFCTDIDSSSINRKPNIGMAYQLRIDFPSIEFTKSIMVGNSRSDIDFGKKIMAYTVLVGDKYSKDNEIYEIVDASFANLYEFALSL